MSMKMKGVEPLQPDVLIAMHLIADFLTNLDNTILEKSIAPDQAESFFKDEILGDLLWGKASYARRTAENRPLLYSADPPIRSLIRIFHEAKLDSIPCVIWLSPDQVKLLENTQPLRHTRYLGSKGLELWEDVKAKAGKDFEVTSATLGEAYNLCFALLEARSELFQNVFAETLGKDSQKIRDLAEFRPIYLSFFPQPNKISEALKQIENTYLDAFMGGHILWPTNKIKWELLVEYLLPILKEKHEIHGDFWLNLNQDCAGRFASNGYNLVETLLALHKRGDINITQMRENLLYDIEFRIHVADRSSQAAIVAKKHPSALEHIITHEKGRGSGDPMNPDLLLTIFLITHYLQGVEEKMLTPGVSPTAFEGETLAEQELRRMKEQLLDDLLWCRTSYANQTNVWLWPPTDVDVLPVYQLMKIFHSHPLLQDQAFHIALEQGEGDVYNDTTIVNQLSDEEIGWTGRIEKELWKNVIEGESMTLQIGADNVFAFLEKLLLARAESIEVPCRDENEEIGIQRAKRFSPIDMLLLSQPAKLRTVLKAMEIIYLQDYALNFIEWNYNPKKWDRQLEFFLPILNDLQHESGDFWVSLEQFVSKDECGDGKTYKFLETLLALEMRGYLSILKVQRHPEYIVQFKVSMKQPPSEIDLPVHALQEISHEDATTELPNENCKELDPYIALSIQKDNMGLYIRSNGKWIFHQQPPQMVKIIQHLYDIRTAPNSSRMVKQLAEMFTKTGKTAPSISRKLSALQNFCKEQGCKQILANTSDGKWTLNPSLGCCVMVKH